MYDSSNYFAVLPATVRYDENLTPRSVLLYAMLTSLASATGEAYASNKYLADSLKVSEPTVNRLLAELEQRKYIKTRFEYKPDSKEIARRLIRMTDLPPLIEAVKSQALYAVIPSHILCSELSVHAKLLYAEIAAATPVSGYCSKNAKYFAELIHVSEATVRRLTRELTEFDAIRTEYVYRPYTAEIIGRRIYLTEAAEMAKKRAEKAAEATKESFSDKSPKTPDVSNTPEKSDILGGIIFDTTPLDGNTSRYRRRIKRGKRKRNIARKRE